MDGLDRIGLDWVGLDGLDGYPGGARYRAPYGANKQCLSYNSIGFHHLLSLALRLYLTIRLNLLTCDADCRGLISW